MTREFRVRHVIDTEEISHLLQPNRLIAGSAFAQMEPANFSLSEWWFSEIDGKTSIIMHSPAGLGDSTFVFGPPLGVQAALSVHPGPYQTFITGLPEHHNALKSAYSMGSVRTMTRMHVVSKRFHAVQKASVQLTGKHVNAINQLYRTGWGITAYSARHIDEGLYCGIVVEDRLVSVAGTHAISPSYSIAVVGNVYTHPDFRGRGYATAATSAVTKTLLEQCKDVVLSVAENNIAAKRTYQHLGYTPIGEILEGASQRRIRSLNASFNRLRAQFRGRRQQAEIVRQ